MQVSEVRNLIEQHLPDVQVEVDGEGCNFQLILISDELAALSPLKRQQQVYALLSEPIADGRIHAVTMKLFTREAWGNRS